MVDSSVVHTSGYAKWVRLFEPSVNLVVHARRASPGLMASAAVLANEPFSERRAVFENPELGRHALQEAFGGQTAVADDLAQLAEALSDLLGARAIGIRVARLTAPMCPAFHVDRVLARVVVAYTGPGSQWLYNCDVERSLLALPGFDAARAGARVQQVPVHHAAIMKGEAWPGNEGAGLVHRSPPPHTGIRVVATLDPLE